MQKKKSDKMVLEERVAQGKRLCGGNQENTTIYGDKREMKSSKIIVPYMGGQKMMNAQEMLIERINNLCKERRMSYYALSYQSAVPLTTLMHIIDKSTANPGIITVSKLCDGFGITMKEFFDSPEFEGLEKSE